MSAAQTLTMSPEAERVHWLRQQRAALQRVVDAPWPAADGRSRAGRQRRKTRENLARVDDILRQVANLIITGRYA